MIATATANPAVRALRVRQLMAWGIALVLGAGVYRVADWASVAVPRVSPLEELAYYPSGEHVRPATMGHAETAADLAWLRAIQYYGEHRRTDNRFEHLFHVFDILTTLSPRFQSAYIFGAFSLAQEGFEFPRAEALMLKGLENNPRSGRLASELAFLYYVKPGGRDLEKAAQYFELAARLPDGPPSAGRFAAYCRQHAGDLVVALQLWMQVKENSPNAYMRDIADKEIAKIREGIATGRKELAVKKLSTPTVSLKPQN